MSWLGDHFIWTNSDANSLSRPSLILVEQIACSRAWPRGPGPPSCCLAGRGRGDRKEGGRQAKFPGQAIYYTICINLWTWPPWSLEARCGCTSHTCPRADPDLMNQGEEKGRSSPAARGVRSNLLFLYHRSITAVTWKSTNKVYVHCWLDHVDLVKYCVLVVNRDICMRGTGLFE
jgi:hypothetical protein